MKCKLLSRTEKTLWYALKPFRTISTHPSSYFQSYWSIHHLLGAHTISHLWALAHVGASAWSPKSCVTFLHLEKPHHPIRNSLRPSPQETLQDSSLGLNCFHLWDPTALLWHLTFIYWLWWELAVHRLISFTILKPLWIFWNWEMRMKLRWWCQEDSGWLRFLRMLPEKCEANDELWSIVIR